MRQAGVAGISPVAWQTSARAGPDLVLTPLEYTSHPAGEPQAAETARARRATVSSRPPRGGRP